MRHSLNFKYIFGNLYVMCVQSEDTAGAFQ